MNNVTNWLIYFLCLLTLPSEASTLKNILFDGKSTFTIQHSGCKLSQLIEGKTKLILPLTDCISVTSGKIDIATHELQEIHWAQHDKDTVWVVITLAEEYRFTVQTFPNYYKLCLPTCEDVVVQNEAVQKTLSFSSPRAVPDNIMFLLQGIHFQIPLKGMTINDFLDRSIGYLPKDAIRDGLPNFGSRRDDWLGLVRKHEGYDIYINQADIVAAADGTVDTVGKGYRSGLYVKLNHGNGLFTVYVHLKNVFVKENQRVKQGEPIGVVDGAAGNAVEAQLHFEIKISDKSVDPLPFIEHFYKDNSEIIQKIENYKAVLLERTRERDKKVKAILKPD